LDIIPYLSFDGTCEEAFQTYASLMGGEVLSIDYYDGGVLRDQSSTGNPRVLAARLRLGSNIIMGSDAMHSSDYVPPQGVRLQAGIRDSYEARRVLDRLSLGGEVEMPFRRTFWAAGFGMCRDRFGISWMINCAQENEDQAVA